MQGYIIDIKAVKDDDLIVTILCENEILKTYRFYGARHSNINIAYKIDFELENTRSNIPRLKDVIQLGFSWILNTQKMYCWQRYIKLFYKHLKDFEEIDSFYFYLLEDLVHKIEKQNVLRAIVDSYISLLKFEGRFHNDFECLICEAKILDEELSLLRGFIPSHKTCVIEKTFKKNKIEELFKSSSSINLDNKEIEELWDIILKGL